MEDQEIASNFCPDSLDVNVQILLDHYLQPKNLGADNMYFCDNCGQKRDATRKVEFNKLPSVLNIQLGRYIFDLKTFRKQKLTGKVILNRTLYVPIERSGRDVSKRRVGLSRKEYVLCAIQNHRGTSAYGGHYVAEAMNWSTGMWFEYDDENVSFLSNGPNSSSEPEVHGQDPKGKDNCIKKNLNRNVRGSSDAYNLFYVEKSFLAKSAKEQINAQNMTTTSLHRNDSKGYDIIAKVIKEKEEAQNHRDG